MSRLVFTAPRDLAPRLSRSLPGPHRSASVLHRKERLVTSASFAVEHAPPPQRTPIYVRGSAAVLTAAVFWMDAVTPPGVVVPVFYVAPILLFLAAGEYWEPL